jgi:hypothetical protein
MAAGKPVCMQGAHAEGVAQTLLVGQPHLVVEMCSGNMTVK